MLENHWYPVLQSDQLRRKPVGVTRFGEAWVLWRGSNRQPIMQHAFCPHRGASLAQGKVIDGELQCPWHGFRFNEQGRCTIAPCEGAERLPREAIRSSTLTLREAHGLVWAWRGAQVPGELPKFDLMNEGEGCSAQASILLPYHYSRMVETNLDVHHTPFVHKRVVPGVGPQVTNATFEERDNGFTYSAEFMDAKGNRHFPFTVEFTMPCLVRIALTEKLQIVVASTPAAESQSWAWFRYYQRYTNLPWVKKLIPWIAVQLEMNVVQKQDWRVFSQMKGGATENVDYRLVSADRPIAAYLKLRRRHLGIERASADVIASAHG